MILKNIPHPERKKNLDNSLCKSFSLSGCNGQRATYLFVWEASMPSHFLHLRVICRLCSGIWHLHKIFLWSISILGQHLKDNTNSPLPRRTPWSTLLEGHEDAEVWVTPEVHPVLPAAISGFAVAGRHGRLSLGAHHVCHTHTCSHTPGDSRDKSFCSFFFNVSQWAGNILDEIFSKEYIQLPSTINLTMTTKCFVTIFLSSVWFLFLSVSMYFGTVRDQHCYSNKKANKTTL